MASLSKRPRSGLNFEKKKAPKPLNVDKASIEQVLRKQEDKTKEEILLEESLFGKSIGAHGASSMSDFLAEADAEIDFAIDTTATAATAAKAPRTTTAVWHDDDDDELQVNLEETNRLKKLKVSKLSDGSDQVSGKEFSNLLRERFEAKSQKWASNDIDAARDEDDILDQEDYDLLNQDGALTSKRKHNRHQPMPSGLLSVKRLTDVFASPHSSGVCATHFHAHGERMLVATDDKQVHIQQVDPEKSENLVAVRFQDMMIRSAKFVGVDGEIVVSGRKPYYYSYHAATGQLTKYQLPVGSQTKTLEQMEISPEGSKLAFIGTQGYVHIADARSKQWIGDLKMNCTARSAVFLDEITCATSGFDADVYMWDLRSSHRPRCVSRFHHEDGTPTASLAAYVPASLRSESNSQFNNNNVRTFAGSSSSSSGSGGVETVRDLWTSRFFSLSNCYLSVCTMSGIASVFEGVLSNSTAYRGYSFSDDAAGGAPKPLKSIMNLTTKIGVSAFHPSGQMLAIASAEKKDQLKMVHVPSCTVFSNWPVSTMPLHKVSTVEFSPNGKYFTVGNQRGKVLLFQLNHFAKNK